MLTVNVIDKHGAVPQQLWLTVELAPLPVSEYFYKSRYAVSVNGVPLGEVEQQWRRLWRATSLQPITDPVRGNKLVNTLYWLFSSRRSAVVEMVERNLANAQVRAALGVV